MTKRLNQAFERISKLSNEEQDALAAHLFDLLDDKPLEFELTPEQEAELKEAITRADRGEFASAAEVDAVFRKYGA